MEKKIKRIGIMFDIELHREFKKLAADYDKPMQELYVQAAREFLAKHRNVKLEDS